MNGYWKAYVELNGKTLVFAEETFRKMANECESIVWYLHPNGRRGKKEHFHALVKNYNKSDDTFRDRLKEAFGVAGAQLGVSNTYKRGTKMSELTIDEYVKYMTKGEHQPFFNKGFDVEWLAKCLQNWRHASTALGDVVVNIIGQGKANRITQVTIAKLALAKYNEDLTANDYNELGDLYVKKKKLLKIVVELLKENSMSRNYRQVANIMQDCWCEISPVEYTQKILSMV